MKLAGAMIFVRDLGAMERFYRDVVGLVPVEQTRRSDWVEFESGWGRFSLHQISQHLLAEPQPLIGEARETGSTKLGFLVPDVSAEAARLRALGVRVIERPWGGFDFVDPEGNVSALEGPPGAVEPVPLAAPVLEPAAPEPETPLPEHTPLRGFWSARIPPLVVTLLFGWAMAAIAGLMPQVTFIIPRRGVVAGAVMLAGVLLMLLAAIQFRLARTTVSPLHPGAASKLVTGGLFRLSRNPMYLGMLAVLTGWAVFLCNPPALIGLWGFVLFVNRFQIGPEERALRARFGAAFEAYMARTRKWL